MAAADEGAVDGEEEVGGDAGFELFEALFEMSAVPAVEAFEVEGWRAGICGIFELKIWDGEVALAHGEQRCLVADLPGFQLIAPGLMAVGDFRWGVREEVGVALEGGGVIKGEAASFALLAFGWGDLGL